MRKIEGVFFKKYTPGSKFLPTKRSHFIAYQLLIHKTARR